ncbi:MAG: transcriptional regulator, partial [Sphingomonas sp.]|nr:transcriptional regulator [Sphingomonas sp.]
DRTMAGQPVAMAVGSDPGDPRYPRFDAVRDRALVAELNPGDAIYIPKLWWHQVEASAPFNVLINYWWDGFSSGPDQPYAAMMLAMITIADRPPAERAAWDAMFDHYVFRSAGHPLAHLPEEKHGLLGPVKQNYGRIRALVMQMLRNI